MKDKFNQITTGKILLLSLAQLHFDPDNPRKTGNEDACDVMVASIRDKGLLQPLSVVPHAENKGEYNVKIGNRRLRALNKLADDGYISKDDKFIRCQPMTGDEHQILEAQLTENIVRKAMNPVEEFEAFASLAGLGQTAEEISIRFGTPVRTIKARLALGGCAQVVRDALKREEITLDAASAYAGCPDVERQERVYAQMQERSWGGGYASNIRAALREERIGTNDQLGQFIDADEYLKRGGEIEQDLIQEFGTYLNTELVYTLRDEKLTAGMEAYSKAGWSFVEVHEKAIYHMPGYVREYGELSPLTKKESKLLEDLKAKLQKLEEDIIQSDEDWTDEQIETAGKLETQIEEMEDRPHIFTPEQMKTLGVFLYPGDEGNVEATVGMKKIENNPVITQGSENVSGQNTNTAENDNPKGPAPLSQQLRSDLGTYRGLAIRAALIENPKTAEDYLIFTTLHSVYASQYETNNTSFGGTYDYGLEVTGFENLQSTKTRLKSQKAVKSEIFVRGDVYGSWLKYLKLTDKQRSALIADAFSRTIQSTNSQSDLSSEIAADLEVSLRDYWTPDTETYFGRIKKDSIFRHIEDFVGPEAAARITNSNTLKKNDAAKLASDIVAGKYPIPADRQEYVAAWVPDQMEFVKNKAAKVKKSKTRKAA